MRSSLAVRSTTQTFQYNSIIIEDFSPTTLLCFSGRESEDQCTGCSPGDYCPEYGMNETAGPCLAMYYCAGNATTDSPTDGVTGKILS